MESKKLNKADQYREHVLAAKDFNGSDREYCTQNGLNVGAFYSYKSEMGLTKPMKKKFVKLAPKETESVALMKAPLPDPRWTAEFLSHFLSQQ